MIRILLNATATEINMFATEDKNRFREYLHYIYLIGKTLSDEKYKP